MKYYEYTFAYTSALSTDIINAVWAAELGQAGFESFLETENGLKGYIPEKLHNPEKLHAAIASFPLEGVAIHFLKTEIADKNWNEEWENNYFKPVTVGQCIIHAPFQEVKPGYTYDIIIQPKMAFGTGNHETTGLLIDEILQSDIAGKAVLDMGCGTALLAILAAKKGASPVVAVDIDEWAFRSALENKRLNHADAIKVIRGGAEQLPQAERFDVIFANINRNILLNDIRRYAPRMNPDALLLMSGFYTEDIPLIEKECVRNGLKFLSQTEKNRWAMVKAQKITA
ncbi:MAG: 50S ribosomal protein L11 methyltransferase [Tannerellaceae bacterium]|nr:50S ribosomal protein L11 methyltransferase [Tannerellaceae bacterium]